MRGVVNKQLERLSPVSIGFKLRTLLINGNKRYIYAVGLKRILWPYKYFMINAKISFL